ncbi:valine--tRNA ligase [Bacteriovoracaceae bacterium]|nr:valine--tRNA ligase [Bacteriovoracaceae bacterium]
MENTEDKSLSNTEQIKAPLEANPNQIEKIYNPAGIEDKWYKEWNDKGLFKPNMNAENEPYSIVIPPPNVTGRLHMGHALDNACQDALIRFKRMKGHKTLWIPGYDHAGISTQAKVEKLVFEKEGKTKHDLGREEFTNRIWKWKEEYGGIIIEQLKKLGVSCDWDYFTFTMDETPNLAVKTFFKKMFDEGMIYQSDYIVNWDPTLQSAISDAEVNYEDIDGHFYTIKYFIKDSDKFLEIATTRPETLFADTAVAVNPMDDRFEDLIGKTVLLPLTNREITIIADEHVDMEKGTGCLKVTPGHDFNDFEIGKRHNLEIKIMMNKDGTVNDLAPEIEGLSMIEARKKTVQLLEEKELLISVEDHKQSVPHGERSGEIVEPIVSKQWFLNTNDMAAQGVKDVEEGEMTFFPQGWENTYFSFLRNPRPWCISRQLWWGHQIPIYYCDDCEHIHCEIEKPQSCSKCNSDKLTQDPDVLDTWFSSGLFPLTTLGWPNQEEMKKKHFETFYPNHTLVTGYDIIFFWVARMMMMCKNVSNQAPFRHTYIHALVRDKDGVKMSKSLGNVVDPLDIIKEYGCDALRFTLLASSGFNRNINLDPTKIEGYRNFINKTWNAFRFIQPFMQNLEKIELDFDKLHHHEKWIISELNLVNQQVNKSMDSYRFDDAASTIYSFVYDKFCSWFIELSKNILYSNLDQYKNQRANVLKYCFSNIIKLLHPFAPFVSEELWSFIKDEEEPHLIISKFPEYNDKHDDVLIRKEMNSFIDIVTTIRNLRVNVNLKPKDEIHVGIYTEDEELAKFFYRNRIYLKDLVNVISGDIKDKAQDRPTKSIMGALTHSEVFIPMEGLIDLDAYQEKLKKNLQKANSELDKRDKKIKNKNFMNNAPDDVVKKVKSEKSEFQALAKSLELSLKHLQ